MAYGDPGYDFNAATGYRLPDSRGAGQTNTGRHPTGPGQPGWTTITGLNQSSGEGGGSESAAAGAAGSGAQVPFNESIQGFIGGTFDEVLGRSPDVAWQEFQNLLIYLPAQTALQLVIDKTMGPEFVKNNIQQIQQFAPQLEKMAHQGEQRQVEADLGRVRKYQGDVTKIDEARLGPESVGIRDEMLRQAGSELNMGTDLSPEDRRNVQQGSRQGEFARGLGTGQGSSNREAVAGALQGRALQEQRRKFAADTVNWADEMNTDPFSTILNRGNGAYNNAVSMVGSPMSNTPYAGTTPNSVNTSAQIAGLGVNAYNASAGLQQNQNQFNTTSAMDEKMFEQDTWYQNAMIDIAAQTARNEGSNITLPPR